MIALVLYGNLPEYTNFNVIEAKMQIQANSDLLPGSGNKYCQLLYYSERIVTG
jgi:hypothetical protein